MKGHEYQASSPAGLIRIRKGATGLWDVYLNDVPWIDGFTLPDHAIDSLVMVEHPFPEGVKFVGNSMTLELSDKLWEWRKLKAT